MVEGMVGTAARHYGRVWTTAAQWRIATSADLFFYAT